MVLARDAVPVAGLVPIPLPTQLPTSVRFLPPVQPAIANKKRKRSPAPQDVGVTDGYGSEFPACDNVGNEVLSCYPTATTNLTQGQFSRFIWNTRFPSFIGAGDVDIYLYHADSDLLVRKWTEHNAKGWVPLEVDDSWFGQRGYSYQTGRNQSYPYYFLVVPAGQTLDGGEVRQPTFTAIQTGPLQAVLSASSASAASASAAASSASSNNNPGNLQQGNNNGGGTSFPSWAIAVLSILGVLALIALLLLSFIILRKLRNDRRKKNRVSHRSSIGSESPMMAAVNQPMSPSGAGDTVRGSYPGTGPVVKPASIRSPVYPGYDGASTTSRANSAGEGLISGADAAIMADAFRKALRKPDFTDRPVEEGESPEQPEEQLMNRELAEEGRDLRSVSSSRGVRVETLPREDEPPHPKTTR